MTLRSFDFVKKRVLHTHAKHSSIVVLALALLLFCWQPAFFRLSLNLAQSVLDNALWDEPQSALQRQASYALAARLFWLASENHQNSSVSGLESTASSMVMAAVAAEHYRRQGDFYMAAAWLQQAAIARPYPRVQEAIKFSPLVKVMPDGSMVIAGAAPFWQVRADTIPSATVTGGQDDAGVFSFVPVRGKNDRAAFEWNRPVDVRYYHQGVLRARVKMGCSLIFETVVDGNIVRHLTYAGTGKWENHSFTLEGKSLKFIYILLGQTANSTIEQDCNAEISSLTFLLDESL